MEFRDKVYWLTSQIPKGRVSTYKEVGKALGSRGYRAVGQALHVNPYAPVVPCHRVVRSDGKLGGFAIGIAKKIRILKTEGVGVKGSRVVNFEKLLFKDFKKL